MTALRVRAGSAYFPPTLDCVRRVGAVGRVSFTYHAGGGRVVRWRMVLNEIRGHAFDSMGSDGGLGASVDGHVLRGTLDDHILALKYATRRMVAFQDYL